MQTSTASIQFGEPVQSKCSENIQTLYVLVLWEARTSGSTLTCTKKKKKNTFAPGTFLWHFAAWRAISSTIQSKMPLIGLEVCSSLGKCLWYTMRTSSIDAAALASRVFTVRQGKLVYLAKICNVTPKYSLELLRSIEKALCSIIAIHYRCHDKFMMSLKQIVHRSKHFTNGDLSVGKA